MTVIKQEAAGTQPGVLGAAARTRGQVSTVVIAPDELEAAVYELAVTPGAALVLGDARLGRPLQADTGSGPRGVGALGGRLAA